MFITLSSLTLNPTRFTPRDISANSYSAKAYPFPNLLPLSTRLAPPPDQSSAQPSSYTSFAPHSRSPPLSKLSSTILPSEAVGYPSYPASLSIINPISSVSLSSGFPGQTMGTSTSVGTSLPPSSTFSSNSGISSSPTSMPTVSPTTSTSTPIFSSTVSMSLSTDFSSTSERTFTSTSLSTLPSSTGSTTKTPSSTDLVSTTYIATTSLPSLTLFTSYTPSDTATTQTPSTAPDLTTTIFLSTTMMTSVSQSSSLKSPPTSTYTITSVILGQEGTTTTDFVTSSGVLSTEPPGSSITSAIHPSPGTIAAIILGVAGTFAFAALWLFCARRRHRKILETTSVPPENHVPRSLDDEILDVEELGFASGGTQGPGHHTGRSGPAMEERYASILAALHLSDRSGRANEGSTGGIYGSRCDTTTDVGEDGYIARTSSPTLPLHSISDDEPYTVPLSPPPPVSLPSYQMTQPVPPPSSYTTSRGKGSPGPDAAAWLGGYSTAPSYNSHYARSQTLGSGSASGSIDALTRTRTGSEEPLLGIGKITPSASVAGGLGSAPAPSQGGNRPGLGSAFGSPQSSMRSPSGVFSTLQRDTSGSYDARTASGSGSYAYTRSATPSSFDILRSVSSQAALSSTDHSHGQSQGYRFGLSSAGSTSSGSTGRKAGRSRHSFGVPPTSFKSRKDRGSFASEKGKQSEKQSWKEKDWKSRARSSTSASASGSMDEKQGQASPVGGVRALLERLRRGGHTPSPHSSNKDLPSPARASMDVDTEKAAGDLVTPPPVATPHRRRFSFILSNPDPHPPSSYSGATPADVVPHQELHPIQKGGLIGDPTTMPFAAGELQPATPLPARYVLVPSPSPAPTEESPFVEGLLHPRLRTEGCSGASLRDFEDYSRPIGGVVKNRMYSSTSFGTQDDSDTKSPSGTPEQEDENGLENENEEDVFGSPTLQGEPRDSWAVDGLSSPSIYSQ